MSGRGARSRKEIKKNIEKQEKKKEAKEFAENLQAPPSETAWNIPIRGNASSSSATPASGRRGSWTATISSHSSDHSKNSGKGRLGASTPNTGAPDHKKYQVKGKETNHPRGRGGGVPPKGAGAGTTQSTYASQSGNSYDSGLASPSSGPPSSLSAQEKAWASMKVWYGHEQPPQRWKGFENDTDMFMPSGDCLVYFGEDSTSHTEPRPMLRIHVEKLQEARSSFLSNLVMYGEIEEEYSPPPSAAGSSSPPAYPLTTSNLDYLDEKTAPSPKDFAHRGMTSPRIIATRSTRSSESQFGGRLGRESRMGAFPTPPRSRTQSDVASSAGIDHQEAEITHELWFPAPDHLETIWAKRRHHLATRNFLALLYNKPIVGADLYDMLSDLQVIINIMYELNDHKRRPNTVAMIIDYIIGRQLDDVRGSLANALGLLAWSEKQEVSWDHGYLEAFIHTVGMLSKSSFDRFEFKRLSPVTRHNLEKAYSGMQIKILNAEDKLSSFMFSDVCHIPNVSPNSPALKSAEDFREYLCRYYAHTYEVWPPKANSNGHWLTRTLAIRLQKDFGALYDVLVNRDTTWDHREERHTRKWQIANRSTITDVFSPDLPGFPITDMLISFDNQYGYLHIPHPYPLLPRRVPSLAPMPSKKKNIFSIHKKDKTASSLRDPSEHMKISLAFGDATNINKLGMGLEPNDLRDRTLDHEKSITDHHLRAVPAADARLGRWLLIYGALQVLSTLSVDTIGVTHSTGVPYFLCPSLENCPPWPSEVRLGMGPVREAGQRESHCWVVPQTWEENSGLNTAAGDATEGLQDARHNHHHGRNRSYELDESTDRVSELDGKLLDRESRERDRKMRRLQHQQLLHAEYEYSLREREREREKKLERERAWVSEGLRDHEREGMRDYGRERDRDRDRDDERNNDREHERERGQRDYDHDHDHDHEREQERGTDRPRYPDRKDSRETISPPPPPPPPHQLQHQGLHQFSRPDPPLRSPMRSPALRPLGAPLESRAFDRHFAPQSLAEKLEMKTHPARTMGVYFDEESEGEEVGEVLPGYAR